MQVYSGVMHMMGLRVAGGWWVQLHVYPETEFLLVNQHCHINIVSHIFNIKVMHVLPMLLFMPQ